MISTGWDLYSEDQPWDFFGKNDAKAEAPVLWPPHAKSWLMGKDSDAGRDWGQEKKGMTEDEMAGWYHWLDGHESEWTPGVGDGPGGLVCCDSWGRKESDTTEWLKWTELNWESHCSQWLLTNYSSMKAYDTIDRLIISKQVESGEAVEKDWIDCWNCSFGTTNSID